MSIWGLRELKGTTGTANSDFCASQVKNPGPWYNPGKRNRYKIGLSTQHMLAAAASLQQKNFHIKRPMPNVVVHYRAGDVRPGQLHAGEGRWVPFIDYID